MDFEQKIIDAAEEYADIENAADKGIASEVVDAFYAGAISDESRNYWVDLVIKEISTPSEENELLIRLFNFKNKVDNNK